MSASAKLIAGARLELILASAALAGQRVALPLAVVLLGTAGQTTATATLAAVAALGFVRVLLGHRLSSQARSNLVEVYARPFDVDVGLGLALGEDIAARASVAFPTLTSWVADGLTSLIGGALAVPVVAFVLMRRLGWAAVVPVLAGGIAGALVTLAMAKRVDRAWDRAWSHWRALSVVLGNGHRGAVEYAAHGRGSLVATQLRSTVGDWSRADARARVLSAAHTWGALGVAALVAVIAIRFVHADAGQETIAHNYLGWLLVLAALPTAQTLVAGAAAGLAALPELDTLERQVRQAESLREESTQPIDPRAPLRLAGISFAYPQRGIGGEAAPVLHDLSLTLPPRGGMVILGPNGAGKTTLLYVLLGLLQPTAGRISVGDEVASLHNRRWRERIAFVPQEPFVLGEESLATNLRVFDPEASDRALIAALDEVGIWSRLRAKAADDAQALARPMSSLSKGQQRRIALARALLRDSDTLLLDEPEASLDSTSTSELGELLRKLSQQKRVIAAVHDRTLVEWADAIIELGKPRGAVDRT